MVFPSFVYNLRFTPQITSFENNHFHRCIPKMDHHCPWIANCVSHRTFPHFLRFLFYGVMAMGYLEYFLYLRLEALWQERHFSSVSCLSICLAATYSTPCTQFTSVTTSRLKAHVHFPLHIVSWPFSPPTNLPLPPRPHKLHHPFHPLDPPL